MEMETIDKVTVAYKLVEECQLRQFIDIVECGLEANTIIRDKGISLLHLAVGVEPVEISNEFTQILLQNGADPNIRSEDFMTPLHVAAAWGRLNAMKLLITYGGDITLIDYERKMPMDYAYEEEHWDIVDYLFEVSKEDDDNVNDDSPSFQLELDKVLLKNGNIVAEYKGEDEVIQKGHFELTEKAQFDWCGNNSNLFILGKNINFFSEITNAAITTTDIILTGDFQTRKCDVFNNVTTRRKAILDDDSSSSFRKRIFNKLKKNKNSNSSDDSLLKTTTTDSSKTSSSSGIRSTDTSKESSDGISYIAFTPTDENIKYSCYYREESDNSLPHSKHNETTSESKIKVPKNKLYPDLSSLIANQEPTLNRTYEVLIQDLSNPEITEDKSDILNACLLGDSQSTSSFKTARSKGCSYIDFTLDKSGRSDIVDETRTSVEEEYRFTDEDEGVVLIERRLLVTPILLSSDNSLSSEITRLSKTSSIASSVPQIMNYDNHTLRQELNDYGIDVGPITDTTKRLYLKKLYKLKKSPKEQLDRVALSKRKCYSLELEKSFRHPNWCNDLTLYSELEFKVSLQFAQPDGKRKWREGNVKSSFAYLLLDPRVTNNLPCRAASMTKADLWRTFVDSIFYVGKGKRSRPYNHLYQAVAFWNKDSRSKSDLKANCILDIWSSGLGVVCLHVFQNVIPVEAYTREAAMIDVLGLGNLKNTQSGSYYGIAASWPMKDRRKLGLYLLYRAMLIFLNEGERQLKPVDIGR